MKSLTVIIGLLSVMGIQACSGHHPDKSEKKTAPAYHAKSAYLQQHLKSIKHKQLPHCHRHGHEKLHCHWY